MKTAILVEDSRVTSWHACLNAAASGDVGQRGGREREREREREKAREREREREREGEGEGEGEGERERERESLRVYFYS